MALPKFVKYARGTIAKIEQGLDSLINNPQLYLYRSLKPILVSFTLLFVILAIQVLIGSDYESILRIAEFTIIGSGTLAILTFTYALVKKDTEAYDKIVRSGELLFQGSITLIIGLGLLPQVGYMFRNHANFSNHFGMFAAVYDGFLSLTLIIITILGMFSLAISAFFLILGINGLIELFKTYSLNTSKPN